MCSFRLAPCQCELLEAPRALQAPALAVSGAVALALCIRPIAPAVLGPARPATRYGAEADARTNFGETPLLVAARAASEAVAGTAGGGEAGAEAPWSRPLRRLLEAGADPDGAPPPL